MAGSQNYSQLPEKARAFIAKHFKDIGIRKCEKYFAKGKYEVELSNGVDLEFNTDGNLIEIDAPGDMMLPVAVVKICFLRKHMNVLQKTDSMQWLNL